MGEDSARADRGAPGERRTIGVAGAQHDLRRVETEGGRNQLRKNGLMALTARSGDAVESNLALAEKTDCHLIFRGQAAARGLKKDCAPDAAQRAAASGLSRRCANFRHPDAFSAF